MKAFRPDLTPGFHWSVRTRILAAILVVTAIGLTVAGLTAYLVQRERILQEVDAKLLHAVESARAITLGQVSEEGEVLVPDPTDDVADPPPVPQFDSPEVALEAILARVLPDRNESSLGMVDGVPRFRSAAEVLFHLEDDQTLVDRIVREVADGSVRLGTHEGILGQIRYIAVPIEVNGVDTTGVFVSAFNLDAELGEITTAFRTYTWVALGTLVAVGLVGWFVAGRLLKPLRRLRETASRITASDLSERIPVSGNDDLSRLTITVNEMLDRIDDSVRSQHQLLDDVRHELKTPITIIRGHLELTAVDEPEDVAATRDLVIEELDRMTSLVDDIEQLAGSESFRLELAPVEVRELLEQIYLKCQALSDHEWHLTDEAAQLNVWAIIDPARITQAMLQLADNASKYSPTGSKITIGAGATPSQVRLWVEDQGPGIPDHLQQRIFERFGRVDTGRGIDGSGLGLPIVQAIATSHGGTVSLDTSPQGSRFTMTLPIEEMEGDHAQHPHR